MTTPLVDMHPGKGRSPLVPVRALAALIVLLVLGALVGLVTVDGPAGSADSDLAVVLGAAEKLEAGPSLRFVMTTETRFGARAMPPGMGLRMEGAADPKTGAASFKATQPFALEIVTDGQVAYARAVNPQSLPGGKAWVAVAASKLEQPTGQGVFTPAFSGETPGAAVLRMLREQAMVKEAQEVGRVDVRGTPTTEYRVTLDQGEFRKRILSSPASRPFGDAQMDDPVIEMAVGDDGLLRRQRLRIGFSAGNGLDVSLDTTTEFFDFGAPVNVRVPPPHEVVTVGTVEEWTAMIGLGGLGGMGGPGMGTPR